MSGLRSLEMDGSRLDELSQKLETGRLCAEDCRTLKALVDTFRQLARQYQQAKTSLKRLFKMIFGSSTEKTDKVLNRGAKSNSEPTSSGTKGKPKCKGHGRLGAADYPGAENAGLVSAVQTKKGEESDVD